MSVEVVLRAPRARCSVCGKPEVAQICHHCGSAMCRDHGSARAPTAQGAVNPEFLELDLAGTPSGEQGVHCTEHLHFYTPRYKWMGKVGTWLAVIGAIVLLIGIFSEDATAARVLGALATVGGITLAFVGRSMERSLYQQEVANHQPPLPVLGKIESTSASETLKGSISFDATGKYQVWAGQPEGSLTLTLQFAPRDQERVASYRRKYGLDAAADIRYHAGFALLRGAAALQFEDRDVMMADRVNTIALTGSVAEQPFLSGSGTERSNRWTLRQGYTFQPERGALKLPLQIFPTLVQEGAQQAIDLNVQLDPAAATGSLQLQQARVEELTLRVPTLVGKVENTEPVAVFTPAPKVAEGQPLPTTQAITWKNVSMPPVGGRASKSFYVRFEHNVEPTTVLAGRLRMRFDGTLSGLEDVVFFDALGSQREAVAAQRYTYVDVEFTLDLGGLRFQEQASSQQRIVRENVVPDHNVVIALTNAISEDGFYVKRVVENRPRTSKVDAHVLNRYWDVAGRYYDGVYPMDFHLVLTGEEVHGPAARTHPGRTQADVVVQGMVTGEGMRSQVESLRESLTEKIQNALETQPQAAVEAPVYEAGPAASPAAPAPAPVPVAQPQDAVRLQEIDDLLRKLDMALLEGRISESRYEEMRARYAQERAALTGHA